MFCNCSGVGRVGRRREPFRLPQRLRALAQVAGPAGRDDVLPGGAPAFRARQHVVEGQMLVAAAVLAGELVAQEQVEAGEGAAPRRLLVGLEHHHRGDAERHRGRMHQGLVLRHHRHPVEHRGLHRLLPRPERQGQVGERPEVGVQDQRRVIAQPPGMPDEARHVSAVQHRRILRAGRCGRAVGYGAAARPRAGYIWSAFPDKPLDRDNFVNETNMLRQSHRREAPRPPQRGSRFDRKEPPLSARDRSAHRRRAPAGRLPRR